MAELLGRDLALPALGANGDVGVSSLSPVANNSLVCRHQDGVRCARDSHQQKGTFSVALESSRGIKALFAL